MSTHEFGWGKPISKERQTELDIQLQNWADQDHSSADTNGFINAFGNENSTGILLTGADVFYLAARALIGLDGNDSALATAMTRLMTPEDWLLADSPDDDGAAGAEGGGTPQNKRNLDALHLEWTRLEDAHLEGAILIGAHLEGAYMVGAHLNGAQLQEIHLEEAFLHGARMENCNLNRAHLEGTWLQGANMEEANFQNAHLEGANLKLSSLSGANFSKSHLEGADLSEARLAKPGSRKTIPPDYIFGGPDQAKPDFFHGEMYAEFHDAHLEGCSLVSAYLVGVPFEDTHLAGASLMGANLESASFSSSHLEGKVMDPADLKRIRTWTREFIWIAGTLYDEFPAQLPPANLSGAYFNSSTYLAGSSLGEPQQGYVSVADVRWNGVNLADIQLPKNLRLPHYVLGDEREAYNTKWPTGVIKDRKVRLRYFNAAVRANRQLAVALQDQGIIDEANHYAYRAQYLERHVRRIERRVPAYIGSLMLDLLAGYGYKPIRSFIAYLAINSVFAGIYALLAYFDLSAEKFGSWDSPFVLSLTSFHGRVFFAGGLPLTDWAARVGAVEAALGLLIEVIFIATFTQRFFGAK